MYTVITFIIYGLLVVMLLYWLYKSFNNKPAATRAPIWSTLHYWSPAILFLLFLYPEPFFPIHYISYPLWPAKELLAWIGLVLCIGGLGLMVWARIVLSTNWSARVERKEGHELIVHGPYSMIRHPIYSGMLIYMLGVLIAIPDTRIMIALILFTIHAVRKLRKEERLMISTFGVVYTVYRQQSWALLPYIY